MAKLGINTGSAANDGTGDGLRVGGGKINQNFDEVYSSIGDGTTLRIGTGSTCAITMAEPSASGESFVGIGSTIPSYMLDVRGGIGATNISISGIATVVDLRGVTAIDATTTATIEAATAAMPNEFEYINVTGMGTINNLNVSGVSTLGIATATNFSVSGVTTFNQDVQFPGASYNVLWDQATSKFKFDDSAKCVFGSASGGDLLIYHTGGNSTIKNETGEFRIVGNDIRLQTQNGSEDYLLAVDGGSVSIFYDDGKKLETTVSGVNITGIVTADNANVAGVVTATSFAGSGSLLTDIEAGLDAFSVGMFGM